ncbi:CGNR zinc finger domain-containing protein [Nocardioides sp. KC13]|uniref:CGNR zinc finger domain-containing protein n=1 Tax=Nocardioides turkmenicus TaxID=2711220 RepID=A0A6M1QUC6_9ACTN|nr:CGNR zinc finger domain-containing protein [Nocardioides sp. KC13]NGN91340.1 CGNR zinc finger domain-containing protein [Nocardioides sp. KC13]
MTEEAAVEVPVLYPAQPRAVRLMNTIWADRRGVHDSLETVAHLEAWAEDAGFGRHEDLNEHDLARARALRDALRRLAADVTADDRPHSVSEGLSTETALAVLNEFVSHCAPALRHGAQGVLEREWLTDGSGLQRELNLVALEGSEVLAEPAPHELRACGGPGCVLYFVRDHPRREWCSAGCGNRARVARHYRRNTSSQQGPATSRRSAH